MRFVIFITSVFLYLNCFGQSSSDCLIVSKFNNIDKNPTVISFSNSQKINNRGGHLQGIQRMQVDGNEYVFLSGSSNSYSYYSVVKLGKENEVISVNQLMDKPFKHAGGFQVYQNNLAVGIEDNEKKNVSKVCIYDISNPEKPSINPVAVIERKGKPLRSTAGCVGFTKYQNKAFVAVGDWDTKNIDFYSCNFDEIGTTDFEKIYSLNTEKQSKKGWIDKNWYSYQNINLFNSNENELYLVGLGGNEKDENIADLYRLQESEENDFTLMKLASKTFSCTKENNFKAGAGVVLSETGEMKIISCSYNIKNKSYLNLFDSQTIPAHAHNDYVHKRPLFDALACNFKSIEADVFSIGDSLFVAHNIEDIKLGRTLRQLYLEPLKNQIEKNTGSVYGNGDEIILFIDIKDDGLKTYKLLHQILSAYKNEISTFQNGVKTKKGILVVVSGNRPFDFMQSQAIRYAGFDGRMGNLDSDISPTLMPVVSDNWTKFFKWNGMGKMPVNERQKLLNILNKAKNKGYILRFWSTPNRTVEQRIAIWKELTNAGVDLVGTDHLTEFQRFYQN